MIQTLLFDRSKGSQVLGGAELIHEWNELKDSLIWINVTDATVSEDQLIAEYFHFNELEMADATNTRHPPKIEYFDDHFLLMLKALDVTDEEYDLKFTQLAMFISDRFIITRRKQSLDCVDLVWNNVKDKKVDVSLGASHLTYLIARKIADNYVNLLIKIEERLEELELLIHNDLADKYLEELTAFNSKLRKINRVLTYHKNIFSTHIKKITGKSIQVNMSEYNDIYEQMERGASLSLMNQQLSTDLVNSFLSITSHRVNKIVKTLTVFTVLFVPLSFIVGLYGMNFEYIPELKFKNGYFYVLGVMVIIEIALLFFLKKLK